VLIVPQFGGRASLPDLSPLAAGADLERDLLLAQLRELAPVAVEAGVVLFLEPLNRYEAYLVNRIEQGARLAEAVGAGVATMGDFFHMGIEETDIAAAFADHMSQVAYVHIADSNRAQPGAGHMDFQPGFRALKSGGYDGWIGLEWSRTVGDYETAVRDAVRLVREQWDAA
jgi:sugar phosphate isomerase/epimerase